MAPQRYTFAASKAGARLDRTLADRLPEISRARVQRLIREGEVVVSGVISTKPSTRLAGGELITVHVTAVEPQRLEPEHIPLDIVFRNDEIIVVDKPAGLVVHPGAGHSSGTLVNALLALVPKLSLVGGERRPGIVHRLDRDTSGLIVVALTETVRLALQAQFQERTVLKSYLALTDGIVHPPVGVINAPIGRSKRDRKRMAVVRGGRESNTIYQTLETFDDHTLVKAKPETGRTHQIRVHFSYLGFPLAGDPVYGRRKRTVPLKRHFLHAHRLTLSLPSTGEVLTFTAPLPSDLTHVLNWLGG